WIKSRAQARWSADALSSRTVRKRNGTLIRQAASDSIPQPPVTAPASRTSWIFRPNSKSSRGVGVSKRPAARLLGRDFPHASPLSRLLFRNQRRHDCGGSTRSWRGGGSFSFGHRRDGSRGND